MFVPATDAEADATSFEYGTTINARSFNMSDYHQVYLFVRSDQIEDLSILLRNVFLTRVTYISTFYCT